MSKAEDETGNKKEEFRIQTVSDKKRAAFIFLREQVCVLVIPKPCSARQDIPPVSFNNSNPKKIFTDWKPSLNMRTAFL
jgi:hypothetical protein